MNCSHGRRADRLLGLAKTWPAHYPHAMPDNPLDINRARFNRIDAKLDLILEGMRNLQVRVTSIEENTAAMNRRLDSMDRRLEHIEKRLDLVEA
jgi:hypothetical protein